MIPKLFFIFSLKNFFFPFSEKFLDLSASFSCLFLHFICCSYHPFFYILVTVYYTDMIFFCLFVKCAFKKHISLSVSVFIPISILWVIYCLFFSTSHSHERQGCNTNDIIRLFPGDHVCYQLKLCKINRALVGPLHRQKTLRARWFPYVLTYYIIFQTLL